MDRTEKATFTNMCMIYQDDMVLVQDRKKSSWSGLSFPGGHIEKEESFVESMVREVFEETGLTIDNLELCGVKQFTTEKTGRYVVMLYKTNIYSGTLQSSEEGDVFWIPIKDITNYELTPDFEMLLEVFLSDKTEFYFSRSEEEWHKELL